MITRGHSKPLSGVMSSDYFERLWASLPGELEPPELEIRRRFLLDEVRGGARVLDYRPEAWTPLDSLVIESEFRWYLTGRFPVIVMPELARRTLGDSVRPRR